jgi:hypothetical protein
MGTSVSPWRQSGSAPFKYYDPCSLACELETMRSGEVDDHRCNEAGAYTRPLLSST